MRKIFLVSYVLLLIINVSAQTLTQKLQKAYQQFEADTQLKHAISSLYVIDAATGQVIFGKNIQVGLAPASTQKIITAATAFELLGKDYRYKTVVGYDTYPLDLKNGKLKNMLFIEGSGDPALGSFRFASENRNQFLDSIFFYIKKAGIDTLDKGILSIVSKFDPNPIPDGWIWQDIGNYYGAGHWSLNWKENQFDLILNSTSEISGRAAVVDKIPEIPEYELRSSVGLGEKGSGDNAYVYLPIGNSPARITGTIPKGEKSFKVSAAVPDPPYLLADEARKFLIGKGMVVREQGHITTDYDPGRFKSELSLIGKELYTHYSPSLDSIIYWFLQKSINLYGEALVRTISYESTKEYRIGSTVKGTEIVRNFWKQKGIDENELNIFDGSGLSPQNRVTTHVQAEILKYAKKQSWFSYFYNGLPEYNGMKMKSGTIRDVKGFCGYHKAKNGKEYIFSFLVNNYNGPSSSLVNKMYKVLDILK